jgi:hypothetical protein
MRFDLSAPKQRRQGFANSKRNSLMSAISRVSKLAGALAVGLVTTLPLGMGSASAADVYMGYSIGGPAAPPAPRVIERPAAPSQGLVWRAGHYIYENGNYVWVDGQWVQPPYEQATWVDGHWIDKNGRQIWIEGHWE